MILLSSKDGRNLYACRKTSSVKKSKQMIFNKADRKFYLPVQQITKDFFKES
jgi:hypothetical protein